jgi:RNA polymerase sigma-70 factor, ECF subfamily
LQEWIKPRHKFYVIISKHGDLQTAAISTTSDEQILELLGSTHTYERGFRLLMAQYKERLYWHIRRIVLVHNDADDVLQNTFIKIYKGIAHFEGKSKLYTWLYRIATNEAITHLQSKARQATASLDDSANLISAKLSADTWFDGDAVQVKLQEAIAQLPDKQKLVFNLRYYDEMPYEEMASKLGTSVGALKASFHHAAKKIEAAFREND